MNKLTIILISYNRLHFLKKMVESLLHQSDQKFDLIISIGDRFEMFAACAASIPFNIPIAHIHGGETTLGAFDDIFRHSITQMSTFHFTAADTYKKRVIELKGSDKNIYCVGALSIDNLVSQKLLSKESLSPVKSKTPINETLIGINSID